MTIGEKIKKLRTAKLMTQADLVGTEITRNMLSQIENGASKPSLDTVLYIAKRLNVSPGFLLSDSEDEQIYFKHSEIMGIKKAFMNEDYRICRDMCLHAHSASDDEIQMILSECNLAIAIEAFEKGDLRAACSFFDEAIESCSGTVYRTDHIISIAGVYFRYLRRLSATLGSNLIDEGEVNVYPALIDEFCRYAMALECFDRNAPVFFADSEIGQKDSPLVLHWDAKNLMKNGNYEEAYEKLHEILIGEGLVAQPVLYFVFCDLEICCRERGDYKGAYEYSIDKIELLQKLLTQ